MRSCPSLKHELFRRPKLRSTVKHKQSLPFKFPVLPMNGNSNQSGNTIRNGREDGGKEVFVVKPSNIRIWIHDKDVGKLTRVLWAGQGNRLRTEVSSNPRVRKFLENVPYVLNVIRDVHQAVIDNNLELVQQKIEPPVPANLITTKDANGLTVMHKAAGLAYTMIIEYLLNIWPDGAVEIDSTGKTPLHWAASAKNNARCYNLLVQAGADEEALDYKMKTPAYYKQKPNDIDRNLLTMLPDAPRVSQEIQPDWTVLVDEGAQIVNTDAMTINQPDSRRGSDVLGNGMNLLTTRSRANSIEQTSEPEVEDDDGGEKLTIEEAALRAAIEEETNESNDNAPLTNGDVANGNDVFSGGGGSPTPHLRDYVNPNLKSDDLSANGNEDNEEKQNGNDEEPEKQNENEEEEPGKEEAANDLENGSAEDVKGDEIDGDNAKEENEDNANEEKNGNEENGNETAENDEAENDEQPPQTDAEATEENPEESVVEAVDNTNDHNDEKAGEQAEEEAEPEKEEDTPEQQNKIEENESNEPEESVNVAEDDKSKHDDKVDDNEDHIEAVINSEDEKSQPDETSQPEDEKSQPDETTQPEDEKNQPNEETSQPEEETSQPKEETSQPEEKTVDDTVDEPKTTETQENQPETNEESSAEEAQPEATNNQSAAEPSSTEEKPSTEDNPSNEDKKLETSNEPKIDDDKKNKEEEDDDDQNDIETDVTDENHNALKSEKNGWSPSTTLEIEGLVQGDPDDNQVQSESAAYVEEGSANSSTMPTADMEQLAALVLNGEGKKLLGTRSDQPEIQAFLDNVPAYMNKIRRVHQAARDGNLRDLQAALDRRKFAIAKDEITPNGASPLHVATIFGHAGIIRYLGGRFPETTSVVDDNGRTALHYAATINDNGHFYNLLTHLGSNPKAMDKLGNTPDFYRDTEQSAGILSYKQLLKEFGAEESLEEEMLSDQGKPLINNSLEIPLFKTEQGQYLASTLGEPLVKGLTEIVERRPSDPVAYLAAFLQNYLKTRTSQPSTPQIRSAAFSQRTPSGGLDSTTTIPSKPNPPQREEIPATPEGYETPSFGEDRDEHGQSMLHFACARSHGRNALLNVIEESEIDITYRDELYRTARDVALQANQPLNAKDIDRFVLVLAAKGDMKAFEDLVAEGYDHILDITDDQSNSIVDVARVRGQYELVSFLEDIQSFEEAREDLHQAIREGNNEKIREIIAANDAARLVRAKNYYGRTALHIAILKENEEMVELFTNVCPAALRAGDNLERTPLHYAMGVNSVEKLSRILIRKGAKRTTKDLKGRQPTYYFMNKADILRLQEEEDEDH